MAKFRPGDRITSRRNFAGKIPVFEVMDQPLEIIDVTDGRYFWQPGFGVTVGSGEIDRIDRQYELRPGLFVRIIRWLCGRG